MAPSQFYTPMDDPYNYYTAAYGTIKPQEATKTKRDWNKEFQAIHNDIQYNHIDKTQALKRLCKLSQDFTYMAKIYGKIIINEKCVPVEDKTIKPVDIGGIAGGVKYIW